MLRLGVDAGFFLALALICYTWIGYPLILALGRRLYKLKVERRDFFPSISVLLSCLNESGQLPKRMENLLGQDYPREKLEIIIASDGSTDNTYQIAASYSGRGIIAVRFAERRGKALVHNDLVRRAKGDIVVFTDTDVRFLPDLLRRLVRPFGDPRVGCVLAEIAFSSKDKSSVTSPRGLYWRFEFFLRQAESDLGILAVASGPCMAIRRGLYKPLAKPTYDSDFISPLDVVEQGCLVINEPSAVVSDYLLPSPRGEFRAGVRMTAKNFPGTLERLIQLNPFLHPGIAVAVFSHKVLRWLTPIFMLMVLLGNAFLLHQAIFRVTAIGQLCFYGLGLLGWLRSRRHPGGGRGRIVSIPYAFCLANAAFFCGILKGLFGEPIASYQNLK